MAKRNCNHCGLYKDEEEFNGRYKALGVRHKTCRKCQHGFTKKYFEGSAKERHLDNFREVARDFLYDYLLTYPCKGYLPDGTKCPETDIRVLEFHHVAGKDMAVSRMVSEGYSIERIKQEISRCQVLCSNCHRRITVEERGWFRGKK